MYILYNVILIEFHIVEYYVLHYNSKIDIII